MSIVAALAWFVLCSAFAWLEVGVSDALHDRGRLGMHRLHMLVAFVWMVLAVANFIIRLAGYGLMGSQWVRWAFLVCLWMVQWRLWSSWAADEPGCGPEYGKES